MTKIIDRMICGHRQWGAEQCTTNDF